MYIVYIYTKYILARLSRRFPLINCFIIFIYLFFVSFSVPSLSCNVSACVYVYITCTRAALFVVDGAVRCGSKSRAPTDDCYTSRVASRVSPTIFFRRRRHSVLLYCIRKYYQYCCCFFPRFVRVAQRKRRPKTIRS